MRPVTTNYVRSLGKVRGDECGKKKSRQPAFRDRQAAVPKGSSLALLVDPAVTLVGDFHHQRQIVPAEAVARLPIFSVLVETAERHVGLMQLRSRTLAAVACAALTCQAIAQDDPPAAAQLPADTEPVFNEDADSLFPKGYKTVRPYLRTTPQPNK